MMSASKDPIDRIIGNVYEICRIMRQRTEQEGKDRTNFLQIHALLIVSEQPGITMKALADALHVTSPSATSLVNRLVRMKLVERKSDAHNRKLVRLKITRGGMALLTRKHRERTEIIREMFALLTQSEQQTFATLHEKVLRSYLATHSSSPRLS